MGSRRILFPEEGASNVQIQGVVIACFSVYYFVRKTMKEKETIFLDVEKFVQEKNLCYANSVYSLFVLENVSY